MRTQARVVVTFPPVMAIYAGAYSRVGDAGMVMASRCSLMQNDTLTITVSWRRTCSTGRSLRLAVVVLV